MTDLLVPIDFSDTTTVVLTTASRLAMSLGTRIVLMHVEGHGHVGTTGESGQEVHLVAERPDSLQDQHHMPAPPYHTVRLVGGNVSALHAQELLQRNMDALRAQGLTVTPILVSGKPIEKILLEAERLQPVLIVLGSHGHGALHHLLLGSVSEGVLRKANCPVVIVPCRVMR
jgi:nucleotide-binding universal stress UspA family protein